MEFASLAEIVQGFLFNHLEISMLNKAISIRTNNIWMSWAKRLASEADRTTAEFIRDVVFLMTYDDEMGDAITQRLKSDQISYSK